MEEYSVYNDISKRTNGEFYLGVCGPVRTGKSTFIKKFMEMFVLPGIMDENDRKRAMDELPQSAEGKTIMTTEPKFIPKEAVKINLFDGNDIKVRMVDCVGYIVEDAGGLMEGERERMVMTPWSEEPMPFAKAAEYGTKKVIHDHSTIGIVITTDGSFGDISRQSYKAAEDKTISELKSIGKPFIVIVNSANPFGEKAKDVINEIKERTGVTPVALNCMQLSREDVSRIMKKILDSFPVSQVSFYLPKWVEMLKTSHWLKQELVAKVRDILAKVSCIGDINKENMLSDSEYIRQFDINSVDMTNGNVSISVKFDEEKYYQILSELVGMDIKGEYELIHILKEFAKKGQEIEKISDSLAEVKRKGYGVITPSVEDIKIDEPELIHHGNKFGVKLRATSPSIHLIQADIETEIAPIVGTKEQAEDLVRYIAGGENIVSEDGQSGIWDTNIFGKTVRQLVEEGIESKVNKLTDESQVKLQDTIQKVINDSNGGLVCIII